MRRNLEPLSRRKILKLGTMAFACSATLPLGNLIRKMNATAGVHMEPKAKPRVEVHFSGKHAFANVLEIAQKEGWPQLPIGQLMGQLGTHFLGTPYVSHTLDHSADREYCIVNLQELDCVTFVESMLALARTIKLGADSDEALARQVEMVRYRGGLCDGFCSRLHYLTDWLHDNQKKSLIDVYTDRLPGHQKYVKKVALMSDRPKDYIQLRKHPEWVPILKKDEAAINARKETYLPKSKVQADEPFMKTGDIVAITTEAAILDCAHTGLCYRDDKDVLRFLHASSDHHQVWLDEELSVYLDKMRPFTGVMLARPLEPAPLSTL